MAQTARAPQRRSTVPEIRKVSGRRFHAVKSEGETFTPEERAAANREFDADVEQERDRYRREGAQEATARQRRTQPRARRGKALTVSVPGVGLSVNDGAGFVLGVLAWVLTVQYIRGGTAGVKAWLKAKFLNQTSGSRPK